MSILKDKHLWIAPIAALAIIFLFCLTQFPTVQPQPKELPIAIVNADEGVQIPNQPEVNMGKTVVDMMQKLSASTTEETSAVKWVNVANEDIVREGLNNQEYYAALILPKDFSAKIVSLQSPQPASPQAQIYINQGMNAVAATMTIQMLNGIVDNMNNNIRSQLLDGMEKQGVTLQPKQVTALATPVTRQVTNINETGENTGGGNEPISFFQPLWIGSLIAAVMLFMFGKRHSSDNRKVNISIKFIQIIMACLASLVAGFGLTLIEMSVIGFAIPQFAQTAMFLSITSLSFILMVLAVLSWTGLGGIGIFVLLLFFGAPLLTMPFEMLPTFYQNWVHPWLPMRFMVDGIREILFFGKGIEWNEPLAALIYIGIVSIVVILLSALKPKSKQLSEIDI